MCVQPGCMKPICERCKSASHKDHQLMELTDYSEKFHQDLAHHRAYLDPYLMSIDETVTKLDTQESIHGETNVTGSQPTGQSKRRKLEKEPTGPETKEGVIWNPNLEELNARLKKQLTLVQKCLQDIEDTAIILDPLESIAAVKDIFAAVQEVYKEDQALADLKNNLHAENRISTLSYPKVKFDSGIDTSETKECVIGCRNGDLVIAGSDSLQKDWRIRRFTRLGQLVWNKPLPLSWPVVDGLEECVRDEEDVLLLSNANNKKIVLLSNSGTTLCYTDEQKAPGVLQCSPDFKRLFFKDRVFDYDEGRIEVLDITRVPFVPLTTITLGFTYTNEIGYLSDKDLLLVTSHKKCSLRALNAADGSELWTLGQHVLGETLYPRGACANASG